MKLAKDKEYNVQEWLPFDKILDKGIIKLKNNTYIKILKIIPINFNLKSDFEKQAIISNYKKFIQTCNFDIQIIIQSKKQDFTENINNIKEIMQKEENLQIYDISKKYIKYISTINSEKKLASKNFYILINYIPIDLNNKLLQNADKLSEKFLNEKYLKIKENLSRCGNLVFEFYSKKEIINILYSFLNSRLDINN